MTEPKILIYDLETGGVNALKADLGFVFCFGYKWLGDKKAHCLRLDDYNGYVKGGYDDSLLLTEATKIIEEADLLVAHFGDYFDRKFINGRLLINNLPPIPNTKQIDTCRLAWKYFNFSSNRLKSLAQRLGCENRKADNEFPGWWLRALAGDTTALDLMEKYNKQDVHTLEEVYLRMRPFLPGHPRLVAKPKCRSCGGKVNYRGYEHAKEKSYHRFQCKECFTWDRDTKAVEAA